MVSAEGHALRQPELVLWPKQSAILTWQIAGVVTPVPLELFVEGRCLRGCARPPTHTRRACSWPFGLISSLGYQPVLPTPARHQATLRLGGRGASRSIPLMPVSTTLGFGFRSVAWGFGWILRAVRLDCDGTELVTCPAR